MTEKCGNDDKVTKPLTGEDFTAALAIYREKCERESIPRPPIEGELLGPEPTTLIDKIMEAVHISGEPPGMFTVVMTTDPPTTIKNVTPGARPSVTMTWAHDFSGLERGANAPERRW